jgi:hypothetical protein
MASDCQDFQICVNSKCRQSVSSGKKWRGFAIARHAPLIGAIERTIKGYSTRTRTMPFAHLILWERTPRWAVAWRRALRGDLRVIETRTASDCERELRSHAASIVAVETSPERAVELGSRFCEWRERHPHCLLFAMGGPQLAAWELFLREAGAFDVLQSRRQVPRLAPSLLRHANRFPQSPPAWKLALWKRLPWPSVAPGF